MTLAARIAEAKAHAEEDCLACQINAGLRKRGVMPYAHTCCDAVDDLTACLLALADEGPHIRKSETACTIACPACRLRRLVEEAMG